MHACKMQILTATVFVAIAAAAASQTLEARPSSNPNPLKINAPGCSDTGSARVPQPPQTYYLELKTTTVQTLANGTTITNERGETEARDSQGRSMSAHQVTTQVDSDGTTHVETFFYVNDPVENTQTDWNTQRKEANVLKLPPKEERHGCWADESGHMRISYGPIAPQVRPATTLTPRPVQQPFREQPKTEDLDPLVIEGLEVHGHRTTTVIPAGQIGNDQPLVSTTEVWFSPLVGRPLRQITDDPRMGRSTTEVVKLDLSDPPPETFQPPEGYTVKVEELHQVECDQR
jgi:hypothetical protein